MTKKDIEKKCREEMQQNIPDREALWQRIETRLPEQNLSKPVNKIHVSFMSRAVTAAACLLFIIAGLSLRNPRTDLNQKENTESAVPAADNASYDDMAEAIQDNEPIAENHVIAPVKSKPIRYSELQVSQEKVLASQVNYQKLGADGEYFNEDEILSKTQYFFDVRVIDGEQDENTGEMTYLLSIIHVLGGEREGEPEQAQITLKSRSAYVLEINHEYILPVYYDDDWNLAYSCAPQIEKTADEQLIIPNGFYTLMTDTAPVLYDSYGQDDYFYDRMFLTGESNLKLLIQKWQSL